jgi:hypothetical protein
VAILADNALLLAFLSQSPAVTGDHIAQAVKDRRQLSTRAAHAAKKET